VKTASRAPRRAMMETWLARGRAGTSCLARREGNVERDVSVADDGHGRGLVGVGVEDGKGAGCTSGRGRGQGCKKGRARRKGDVDVRLYTPVSC